MKKNQISVPGCLALCAGSITIGHGAVVHGKHIGDGAVIGMGAIVLFWSAIGEQAIVVL